MNLWFNKASVFSLGLRNVVRAANHCQQTRPPWFLELLLTLSRSR